VTGLTAYLWTQAQQRPVDTARFVAGELWRRGRLRWINSFDRNLPAFANRPDTSLWQPFLATGACDPAGFHAAFPGADAGIFAQADAICRQEFTIFGQAVKLGEPLDWRRDWRTGYAWPLEPAARLRVLDAPPGADVKRPWELARFHHALTLGRAWALTGEGRYAAEFAAQVRHWIRANPYARGIHWAMPMEAALRCINWLTAAALMTDAPELDAAFWRELQSSLFLQGRFVHAHRERNPVARGNHHLSCVAGLLHLGVAFRRLPEGRAWLESARVALREEMAAQVGADGVAHEGSSGYHAFVTELFTQSALLAARLDAEGAADQPPRSLLETSWGAAFTTKLERMFEFPAALLAGRASAPLWGDADDGRVLPLCAAEANGMVHLVALGGAVFERADWPAPHPCQQVWWQLGRAPAAPATPGESPWQPMFPAAGFYFFSSPRLRGSVRCGPLGVNGWANHAHNDQLSFELSCDGRAVIVDPGSFCYAGDAAARNRYRSSRAHNSPVVDGAEQNRFWPGLLFRIVDDARARAVRWSASPRTVEFEGRHLGYQRLPQRVTVHRFLHLDREANSLLVADTLTGQGSAGVEWFFQLAPGTVVQPLAAPVDAPPTMPAALRKPGFESMKVCFAWHIGPLVLRLLAGVGREALESGVLSGEVAASYGVQIGAPRLRVACADLLPMRVVFAIEAGADFGVRLQS